MTAWSFPQNYPECSYSDQVCVIIIILNNMFDHPLVTNCILAMGCFPLRLRRVLFTLCVCLFVFKLIWTALCQVWCQVGVALSFKFSVNTELLDGDGMGVDMTRHCESLMVALLQVCQVCLSATACETKTFAGFLSAPVFIFDTSDSRVSSNLYLSDKMSGKCLSRLVNVNLTESASCAEYIAYSANSLLASHALHVSTPSELHRVTFASFCSPSCSI